jgi:ferredoxin
MMDNEEIYRKLQEHLDTLPVGFPATKTGVEIRLLKRLFSLDEAKVALHMKWGYESATDIFDRISEKNMTLDQVKDHLKSMSRKGAIFTSQRDNIPHYSLAMWVIGMYELQVNNLSEELVQEVSQYSADGFNRELVTSAAKTSQFRVIPINKSIDYKSTIAPYNNVRNVIENFEGPIAVANCICRQRRDLDGDPCKLSDLREVCMPLGDFAYHYIEHGLGKEITKQEAMNLITTAEEKGFIIQSSNSQTPGFFCLCCGDCCGYLRGMKDLPRPVSYFGTNFHAVVDSDLCSGCETCLERCQMDALTIVDGISAVNRDRCVGCGLCVPTCPEEAIELLGNEQIYVPPPDYQALYDQIRSNKAG